MEYQKRDPFFANRYIRLMTKSAAGMEITAEGIALCAIIVMQEDTNRYSGPVNFWNSQLCAILGIPGDENRFRRIREKCVREKWIHYTAGAKSKAARYFATIPEHLSTWSDAGCSENMDDKKHNPDTITTQSRHNPAENLPRICRESAENPTTSYHIPIHNHIPSYPGGNARDPDNTAEAEGIDDMLASMKTPRPPAQDTGPKFDPPRRNKIPDDDSAKDWVECSWDEREFHPFWFLVSRETSLLNREENWEAFLGLFAYYPLKYILKAIDKLRDDGKGTKLYPDAIMQKCNEMDNK